MKRKKDVTPSAGNKGKSREEPIKIPLPFEKAIEGLLAVKPPKKKKK